MYKLDCSVEFQESLDFQDICSQDVFSKDFQKVCFFIKIYGVYNIEGEV